MRVVLVLLLALTACGGESNRPTITINAPPAWLPIFDDFAEFTDDGNVSVGTAGDFHVEIVEDSAIPGEGYRVDRSGTTYEVHARDVLGAQYGAAAALENLGFRFRHPYAAYVPAQPVVGTPEHLDVMAGIAAGSVTELRNAALPLAGRDVLVTGWGVGTTTNLTNALTARGVAATRLYTGSPNADVIAQAVAAAREAGVTVVTTYNAWSDGNQRNLVAALLATGKPIVVVAVGGPYDIAYLPEAGTYLAAYGYQMPSIVAVADVLTGRQAARGRLPVTIRTADGREVLFRYGTGSG